MNYDENRLRRGFRVEFRVIESQNSEFSSAVETLQHLHQARRAQLGDVGVFQTVRDAQLNTALLKACGEREWTRLFLLLLDGAVVAGFSGFEFRNQLLGETFSINPDERWRKFSVGNVLLGLIVRWGIERSLTAVDLSRGDEHYKLRFGGIPSRNYRAVAHSSSLAALMSGMERVRRGLGHSPLLKRIYAACRR
jgi:CelD/BcsL family acetyltransferase involved in cellulose biosynthesis